MAQAPVRRYGCYEAGRSDQASVYLSHQLVNDGWGDRGQTLQIRVHLQYLRNLRFVGPTTADFRYFYWKDDSIEGVLEGMLEAYKNVGGSDWKLTSSYAPVSSGTEKGLSLLFAIVSAQPYEIERPTRDGPSEILKGSRLKVRVGWLEPDLPPETARSRVGDVELDCVPDFNTWPAEPPPMESSKENDKVNSRSKLNPSAFSMETELGEFTVKLKKEQLHDGHLQIETKFLIERTGFRSQSIGDQLSRLQVNAKNPRFYNSRYERESVERVSCQTSNPVELAKGTIQLSVFKRALGPTHLLGLSLERDDVY